MQELPKPLIIQEDCWLEPYEDQVRGRMHRFDDALTKIKTRFGSLQEFASWNHHIGLHHSEDGKSWILREWAPGAQSISLIGDFNDWNPKSHTLTKNSLGIWEIVLPEETLLHEQKIKLHIHGADGSIRDRIPSCITRVIQDAKTYDFSGQIWNPSQEYKWKHDTYHSPISSGEAPRIYEAHPGIAGEEHKVHDFQHFTQQIIPRIAKAGYNCIQLMAIAEHPYYGSFGYHVSNFFAVSSRFGTPEDLKELIDTAHSYGLCVLLDLVHSHSVKNIAEGLNGFDGTDHQYFHAGARGNHPDWDSKLFHYQKEEVQRFLLSNIRYWIEEYHIDGFRFDGVTSMLYHHQGNTAFDHYDKYFVHDVDQDALLYLQLACSLARQLKPDVLLIAEDMSGMPGLVRKIPDGGLGFDYRLAMGIPDYWIKLLKHSHDEEWNLDDLWSTLSNRRKNEKNICYAESHDQALVGDKTLAFWLMDKDMYTDMSVDSENLVIDRGIALHKIIRLLTLFIGGEGWLNFIGNEFGHPEWLDFPREGNNFSYQYSRRQWSLADNPELRYQHLAEFDKGMMEFAKLSGVLSALPAELLFVHNEQKVLAVKRNGYILAVNLHIQQSYTDYSIPSWEQGDYKIVLDTDSKEFGGFGRLDPDTDFTSLATKNPSLSLYLPSRVAMILGPT